MHSSSFCYTPSQVFPSDAHHTQAFSISQVLPITDRFLSRAFVFSFCRLIIPIIQKQHHKVTFYCVTLSPYPGYHGTSYLSYQAISILMLARMLPPQHQFFFVQSHHLQVS
jgi:hypothetical protein